MKKKRARGERRQVVGGMRVGGEERLLWQTPAPRYINPRICPLHRPETVEGNRGQRTGVNPEAAVESQRDMPGAGKQRSGDTGTQSFPG